MIQTAASTGAQESLPEFLSREARRASDGALAVAATFGALVALASLLWRPHGWTYFVTSGLTCGAFGAWGIMDRLLGEQHDLHHRTTRVLRAGRFACGALGTIAGVGLVLRILFIGLGTWIS